MTRQFLGIFAICFSALLMIWLLQDLQNNLSDMRGGKHLMHTLGIFYGTRLPFIIRELLPYSLLLSLLFLWLGWQVSPAWFWPLLLTVPVLALGIYDITQRQWTILRNYPVAARLRWLFYDLRPFLRAYIVEDDLHGTPFPFAARSRGPRRAS